MKIFRDATKIFNKKVDKLKEFGYFCKVFCRLTKLMGKFSEYKLPLKSMPVGSQEFDYQIGSDFFVDMEDSEVRDAAVKVKLKVEHKNDYYDMHFSLSGEVTVACDRCLDDLVMPIDTTYHIIVKYGESYRDDSDEYLEIPYNETDINVAYMIHDTIALAIPIKHVHRAGECNEAMSTLLNRHSATSSDDNDEDYDSGSTDTTATPTDNRWDKLKDLNLS